MLAHAGLCAENTIEQAMNQAQKTLIKLIIVLLLSGSMLLIPFEEWGIPIYTIQSRVIALFVFAALMWLLDVIPICPTTARHITLPPM